MCPVRSVTYVSGRSKCTVRRHPLHNVPKTSVAMAGLDTLDGKTEAKPPNGEPTQVEETIGRGKRHAVVGADGLRQAAFLEQALKGSKGPLFFDGLHGFAEQKITAGVVRDGKGVTISSVPEHELALEIGAPQSIRSKSLG